MNGFDVKPLPPLVDLETKPILKKLTEAHRYLAELKGVAASIPNESILINTLSLQEAKDSSAIENIVTTHDELYKACVFANEAINPAAKEIARYAAALRQGFQDVRKTGLITTNLILEIQQTLEQNHAGFRKLPGTTLKHLSTGETVYIPPQDPQRIVELMGDLDRFMNDDTLSPLDPLVKAAIIHYQFESIHPFYDGNGRTGRIVNILYLVARGLLNLPILYLSRYIIRTKVDYYRLLQTVRDKGTWEEWVLYVLNGIADTSRQTITLVEGIRRIMLDAKHRIRKQLPKIYSQDLLNNLFRHPYTKIGFLQKDLSVSRLTATRYLDRLVTAGFLKKHRIGRSNYYVNTALVNLLTSGTEKSQST